MLILAGPNNSGKSFIQFGIITPLLGGREFDPTDFFKNDSGFNKHMMASEHLAIHEFAFPLDNMSRLILSEKLKKIVANDSQTYHPKGRDAMTMHPQLRLSISINDNPEKIRALPPMNNDLLDKVVMLRLRGDIPMPMPTNSDEEEGEFARCVRAQLPAFVHFVLHWQPPEAIAVGRFGMKTWQHPELVDMLWEQEPVSRFAHLLDRALFPAEVSHPWPAEAKWGKSAALEEQLTAEETKFAQQFRTMFKSPGICSQYLGILHKKETERIAGLRHCRETDVSERDAERRYAKKHTNTCNVWQIRPPSKSASGD
jgi:hypothetical protein